MQRVYYAFRYVVITDQIYIHFRLRCAVHDWNYAWSDLGILFNCQTTHLSVTTFSTLRRNLWNNNNNNNNKGRKVSLFRFVRLTYGEHELYFFFCHFLIGWISFVEKRVRCVHAYSKLIVAEVWRPLYLVLTTTRFEFSIYHNTTRKSGSRFIFCEIPISNSSPSAAINVITR